MRFIKLTAILFLVGIANVVNAAEHSTTDYLSAVSPALSHYTNTVIKEDLLKRPSLSPRDRAFITLTAMIARNQQSELKEAIVNALDNGVKPAEISETITQLAFYAGRDNALNAAKETFRVFKARNIDFKSMPSATPELIPLDQSAEDLRLQAVHQLFGDTGRPLAKYTTEVLFRNLWLRPGLTPRDRSLITVTALIANGNSAQMPLHLNRAMDEGLTQEQAEEMIAQLAFYIGWPNAFAAQSVATDVFKRRNG